MFKVVLLVLAVLCVVNTQSDDGCKHSRSYTRVKRGKYPGPPLRFYSRPPMTLPIKGPFSYTPPPFIMDDEPPYPGSRPYKVSKRPTYEGLGDDDISNLMKHLTKQDLDKIIEFASEKDNFEKSKDFNIEYNRPYKRENFPRPTYTKDFYKGNIEPKYQEEKPYEVEFKKYINYVTEATPLKYESNTYQIDTDQNKVKVYDRPPVFKVYAPQEDDTVPFKSINEGSPNQFNRFSPPNDRPPQFNTFTPQNNLGTKPGLGENSPSQNYGNPNPGSDNIITETAEDDKLPPPDNMREIDFDISFTNNVPTVVKAESSSYPLENFGDLPLMNDYNSKLHSVSSYHVPHYTVTQTKSQSLPSPPASSYSSSALLKPSPAAASVKAPPVEPAPPPSAAKEQSDAHLKAIKIWSHRSKGAAYTLHDDGSLTPEWSRPKYG